MWKDMLVHVKRHNDHEHAKRYDCILHAWPAWSQANLMLRTFNKSTGEKNNNGYFFHFKKYPTRWRLDLDYKQSLERRIFVVFEKCIVTYKLHSSKLHCHALEVTLVHCNVDTPQNGSSLHVILAKDPYNSRRICKKRQSCFKHQDKRDSHALYIKSTWRQHIHQDEDRPILTYMGLSMFVCHSYFVLVSSVWFCLRDVCMALLLSACLRVHEWLIFAVKKRAL